MRSFRANSKESAELHAGFRFKLDPAGKLTVLHSFAGGTDGANPAGAGLILHSGNFSSTAAGGGTYGNGTVFKLDTTGKLTGSRPGTSRWRHNVDRLLTSTTNGGDNFAFVIVDGGREILGTDISAPDTVNIDFKKQ